MTPPGNVSIRALTLHVLNVDKKNLEAGITRLLEYSDKIRAETGMKISTLRLVTPPASTGFEKTASLIQEYAEKYGIDYYAIPLPKDADLKGLPELLDNHPRLFTSIPYSHSNARSIVDVLQELSEISWLHMARLAVAFGGRHNTPYFPSTETRREGVTASLLYPRLLMEVPLGEAKNILWGIHAKLEEIIGEFQGIDYSLSPWMEESVALVIEKLSGASFTLPGTIHGIIEVNRELEDISRRGGVGYNEVMLPLGEDNRLKQLARDGQLRFSHLLNYTAYCVAGLDMVPIPDTTEPGVILNVMRDLEAIFERKKRPLAMRIILVGAEEGEEISLGFFGKIPVLNPLY